VYGAPVHYEWCPDHKWTADTAVDASVVADGVVAEILSPPITEPQVDLPAQTELHEGVPTAGSETEQGAQVGGPSENPNLATVVEGVALSGASANVQLDNSSTVVDVSASSADPLIEVLIPSTAVAAPSDTARAVLPNALPPASCFLPSLDKPVDEIEINTPIGKLMWLARDIKQPRRYVGYSGWVAFALMQKCRLFMWEGENRTNMIETFAPWSTGFCTAEVSAEVVFCKCYKTVANKFQNNTQLIHATILLLVSQ
jgi:hypothetical protein